MRDILVAFPCLTGAAIALVIWYRRALVSDQSEQPQPPTGLPANEEAEPVLQATSQGEI
jgi:hypothetical protein